MKMGPKPKHILEVVNFLEKIDIHDFESSEMYNRFKQDLRENNVMTPKYIPNSPGLITNYLRNVTRVLENYFSPSVLPKPCKAYL
jgi:hypothetical protein